MAITGNSRELQTFDLTPPLAAILWFWREEATNLLSKNVGASPLTPYFDSKRSTRMTG
jgi:hypothetical protein